MKKETRKKLSEKMLFSEWNQYWLSLVQYRLRITTLKRYEEAFDAIIDPAFQGKRICDISDEMAQEFFNQLREEGMSVARCSSVLAIAKLSLDYALNRKLIRYNPFALVQLPRKFKKKTAILYDDDIRKLFEEYETNPFLPLFAVILLCGLRIGEALGLTWNKVDLHEKTVEISQQLISYRENGEQVYRIVPYTKNGEVRILCLPEIAAEWLIRQKELQEQMKRESSQWDADMNLVFSDENGDFMKYHQARYQFKKIMDEIGRSDVTLHSLRHTAAATVLYTTGDIAAQQRFLGHRSVLTSRRYGDATLEAQRRFADAIDAAFAEICAEGLGIELTEEIKERLRRIREQGATSYD